ncbi:MAG: glutamate--tRNA ligase [Pseudomonadota bacterium]
MSPNDTPLTDTPAPDTPAIVTRFAPSPTGFLHIGGARTALFNWLYARGRGGRFLLRIEDTDRARSTDEAIQAILEGLTWLGLDWDDEPVFQHTRAQRHASIAQQLLESGHAYRCYASTEELDAMREAARAEGRPPIYDGRWRDRDPSEAPSGVNPVIRFKAPRAGETSVIDEVQGTVTFPNKDLDDLIILRADGTPTYNLSVVVDDHDMGITHVVRGVDHLTNAARQSLIFNALGWRLPTFAHVPLIHGADGAKLSKRHGALGVEAYRDMGFLPAALRNYLVRLGWSHGDDEIMSDAQMLSWFDLPDIGRSPARLDVAKMTDLNAHHLRETPEDALFAALETALPLMPELAAYQDKLTPQRRAQLRACLPALRERARTLADLVTGAAFIFAERPLTFDAKAAKLLDDDARAMLGDLKDVLAALPTWEIGLIETTVRDFTAAQDLKLGKVAQPLRAALTGSTMSPPIFDVVAILEREEALARLADVAGS